MAAQTSSALSRLLASASIEVTAREPGVAGTLSEYFAPNTSVHVTFLPDDDMHRSAETCASLRQAGFNPIPHLTARNFTDRDTLARHLEHLTRDVRVVRALVIAGDVDRPRGPFSSSIDLMRTGLLEQNGIRTVLLAGHPEGHPVVSQPVLDAALRDKIAFARERGLTPEIVTQFCLEAEPIVNWLKGLRRAGIDAPVRIGVAGPAGTASLLKFAMRCGVGNSVRALRQRGSVLGKLVGDTTPDGVLDDLAAELDRQDLGEIAGIHLYMFGGVRKTSQWLNAARRRAEGMDPPRLIAGQ